MEISGVWKHFGSGPAVLADASLTIRRGEIHGLLGANGSGKSTLIKILAGFHDVDAGALTVRGESVGLPLIGDRAYSLGLRFVHQDLGLVGALTAVENYLIPWIAGSGLRVSMRWRRRRAQMQHIMGRYGLSFDLRVPVADLRPVDRALLAIVRAFDGPGVKFYGDRLIVLDEPTVFLAQTEIDRLFAIMRQIASSGSSVLFVSHDLDEIRAITDRVTVLRNGRVVMAGQQTAGLSGHELVQAIVGDESAGNATRNPWRQERLPSRNDTLKVEGMRAGRAHDVSIIASSGEVIGLTGLIGDGYEDVVRALSGAIESQTGRLAVNGRSHDLRRWSPAAAVANGVVLVPGDRLADGIVSDLSMTDNVTLPRLGYFRSGPFLRRGAMTRFTRYLAERYDVRPPSPSAIMGQLSGGNQQKAVLGKWIETAPRVLLLHEPTQGVDVGARQQIFQIIRQTAKRCIIICASSDHEQLAEICDHVLIIRRGRVRTVLARAELTKARITAECLRAIPEQESA